VEKQQLCHEGGEGMCVWERFTGVCQ